MCQEYALYLRFDFWKKKKFIKGQILFSFIFVEPFSLTIVRRHSGLVLILPVDEYSHVRHDAGFYNAWPIN